MSTSENRRTVTIERIGERAYRARNARGGELEFGGGSGDDFTPVELLLTAIGGCSGIDVDIITGRRATASSFRITVGADKIRDDDGNHLSNVEVTFDIVFPDGDDGDAARTVLPEAVRKSHDRLCTVSRTVELETPVTTRIADH